MRYNRGDIVLISFPFTTLSAAKKRPVLIMKHENRQGDFICFQITSKKAQSYLHEIHSSDLKKGSLKITSFIKYDKCFTLNSELVDKKVASLNEDLLKKIKILFCSKI